MIAVIADDLTGAAELAGIGLRYNLSVELVMAGQPGDKADLLIICTDSRSMTKAAAQRITGDTVKTLAATNPDLVYKKIDSVLRGHILDEIMIQMLVSGKRKALIVPANPSLDRTVTGGHYYIGKKPIAETGFAADPEFGITSSSVVDMLKTKPGEVLILTHSDVLPQEGIVMGEAVTAEDIKAWSDIARQEWLLAGAGDFFTALLEQKYSTHPQQEPMIRSPHLYISGTAFAQRKDFIREIDRKTGCVIYLTAGSTGDEKWVNSVMDRLQLQGRAIVAIDPDEKIPAAMTALAIRSAMASAVKQLVDRGGIGELFIEGGSTAAAILKELDIKSLEPVHELQRGVVRMKAMDMYITVKPGSYALPEQIEKLYFK